MPTRTIAQKLAVQVKLTNVIAEKLIKLESAITKKKDIFEIPARSGHTWSRDERNQFKEELSWFIKEAAKKHERSILAIMYEFARLYNEDMFPKRDRY